MEDSLPYIIGFIVVLIYAFGHHRGVKSERANQESLLRRLTIDKMKGDKE
jgi:hypothetical protein